MNSDSFFLTCNTERLNLVEHLRCYNIFWVLLLFFGLPSVLKAQDLGKYQWSNLRAKKIAVQQDSIWIDNKAIVGGSFYIEDISSEHYQLFPEMALLVWRQQPQLDSVQVHYRTFPFYGRQEWFHKTWNPVNTRIVSQIYNRNYSLSENPYEQNNSKLTYSGSYGRSFAMGNNQDVVLNAQFNLQANGYILDSVKLEAAISDNNVPFQPSGNTKRLQEFDQVFIRLSKKSTSLQLGDYNLFSQQGYFLKFNKRVQGAYYQDVFGIKEGKEHHLGISASISKGQFQRNVFQGQEGNQGPYKLSIQDGALFFVVLAATEKVYVDGQLMERGESADYIIDYNTAEVKFMPRKMISKDARIQIEFEYQDRNYLNSLVYVTDEFSLNKNWHLKACFYNNQDAKNQPYLQNLNSDQKRFLATIGDSVQLAYYPSISQDSFGANKLLYLLKDTLVAGFHYDSVFVYTTSNVSNLYALNFSYVGANKGDYKVSNQLSNGKTYEWIAPVNGIPQGDYQPVQLLIAPKKQQLFILESQWTIDTSRKISTELAYSDFDPNLYSDLDNNSHKALAAKWIYHSKNELTKQSNAVWSNKLSLEVVQENFKAIAPFRNVEFYRDWALPMTVTSAAEKLFDYNTSLERNNWGSIAVNSSFFERGQWFQGWKNAIKYDWNHQNYNAGFNASLLTANDSNQKVVFYRPKVYFNYKIKVLQSLTFGASYELEQKQVQATQSEFFQPNSFSFDVITAFIALPRTANFDVQLTYFKRTDQQVKQGDFKPYNHSHNLNLKSNWFGKNQQLSFTGSLRQLVQDDTSINSVNNPFAALGRLEYRGNYWNNTLTWNGYVELGSGQEQKRGFTYLEVPIGQGMYMWVDYNSDSVQQVNEFELAVFPDQKKFIRLPIPTNEFVLTQYGNVNFSVSVEPYFIWNNATKGLKKIISKFSYQSSIQNNSRWLKEKGTSIYFPWTTQNSLLMAQNNFNQTLFFNRNNSKYGLDFNFLYLDATQLMLYGIEVNQTKQFLAQWRWNVAQQFLMNVALRKSQKSSSLALAENRNYLIDGVAFEPSISFFHNNVFRLTGLYKYDWKRNAILFGGQRADAQTIQIDGRWSQAKSGVINARISWVNIDFQGENNMALSFNMLESLKVGRNWLWKFSWDRRLGKGIEMSFEYEGRTSTNSNLIHNGRMSLRAIL